MKKVTMKSRKPNGRRAVKLLALIVLLSIGLATRAYGAETATTASAEPPTVNTTTYALDYTEAVTWGGDMGHEAWYALLADGSGVGSPSDGTDDMLYVPIGTTVFVQNGIATVTAWGLAFCVDGAQLCTGDEFQTPEYLTRLDYGVEDVPGTVNA